MNPLCVQAITLNEHLPCPFFLVNSPVSDSRSTSLKGKECVFAFNTFHTFYTTSTGNSSPCQEPPGEDSQDCGLPSDGCQDHSLLLLASWLEGEILSAVFLSRWDLESPTVSQCVSYHAPTLDNFIFPPIHLSMGQLK